MFLKSNIKKLFKENGSDKTIYLLSPDLVTGKVVEKIVLIIKCMESNQFNRLQSSINNNEVSQVFIGLSNLQVENFDLRESSLVSKRDKLLTKYINTIDHCNKL